LVNVRFARERGLFTADAIVARSTMI